MRETTRTWRRDGITERQKERITTPMIYRCRGSLVCGLWLTGIPQNYPASHFINPGELRIPISPRKPMVLNPDLVANYWAPSFCNNKSPVSAHLNPGFPPSIVQDFPGLVHQRSIPATWLDHHPDSTTLWSGLRDKGLVS